MNNDRVRELAEKICDLFDLNISAKDKTIELITASESTEINFLRECLEAAIGEHPDSWMDEYENGKELSLKVEEMEAEVERLREALDAIFEHCRVIYYPTNGDYPIEHHPLAKPMRKEIEHRLFTQPSGEASRQEMVKCPICDGKSYIIDGYPECPKCLGARQIVKDGESEEDQEREAQRRRDMCGHKEIL